MTTEQCIQQIIKNRTAQGFSPRAIAHQINKELKMSDNQEHLCRDCGKPMKDDQQEQRGGKPPLTIITCMNRDCALWSVTLSVEGYQALTDAQFADYRKMVANLKATIAKRSE